MGFLFLSGSLLLTDRLPFAGESPAHCIPGPSCGMKSVQRLFPILKPLLSKDIIILSKIINSSLPNNNWYSIFLVLLELIFLQLGLFGTRSQTSHSTLQLFMPFQFLNLEQLLFPLHPSGCLSPFFMSLVFRRN